MGLDPSITRFVPELFNNRSIKSKIGTIMLYKAKNRCTPQSGLILPKLWNIALNNLLMKLDSHAVAKTSFHLNTLSSRMEIALELLSGWCVANGLSVNAPKTKFPKFKLPSLNGSAVALTDSAEYLNIGKEVILETQHTCLNN